MFVEWDILLQNTNSLMQSLDPKTFKVEIYFYDIYDDEDYMIEQIKEGFFAYPPLTGAGLDDVYITRVNNKLGGMD